MPEPPKPSAQPREEGRQYQHIYLDRGDPTDDSLAFRVRLCAYVTSEDALRYQGTKEALRIRLGIEVPNVDQAFKDMPIATLLSIVTVVADELLRRAVKAREAGTDSYSLARLYVGQRERFVAFVRQALLEEHLAYEVDDHGGVHPLVDKAFQLSKAATIAGLEGERYANVRNSVEKAFDRFSPTDADSRAAVAEMFYAAESLFKLMLSPRSPDLTEGSVKDDLGPLVNKHYSLEHASAASAAGRNCASFGKWAHACHPYRHGHGVEEPVPPPMDLAVALVSEGASFIRWLVDIDKAKATPPNRLKP